MSESYLVSGLLSSEILTCLRTPLCCATHCDAFTYARVFAFELVELFGIADLLMNLYSYMGRCGTAWSRSQCVAENCAVVMPW